MRSLGLLILCQVIMVEAFLRTMLGTAGYRLLELYVEHALPINAIILAYLGMIFLGRKSFWAMKKALKTEIEQVTNKSPNARPEAWFAKVLESASIDWEKIGATTKIPFFSPDNYWWFGLKNEKSIRKHCSPRRVASWYSRKDEPNDQNSSKTSSDVTKEDA